MRIVLISLVIASFLGSVGELKAGGHSKDKKLVAPTSGYEGMEDQLARAMNVVLMTLNERSAYQHDINDALVKMILTTIQFAKDNDMIDELIANEVETTRPLLERVRRNYLKTGQLDTAMVGMIDRTACAYQLYLKIDKTDAERSWESPFGLVLEQTRRMGQHDLTEQEVHDIWIKKRYHAFAEVVGVELSISDGAALSGYTDTLEISINNESEIGFFYIEITDDPDYIIAEAVLQTDRTQNYTLSVTETNGVMVVSAFPNGSSVTLESGNDPVCKVIVRGASMEPAFVDLDFTFANIENYNGVEMNWTGDDADFEVSVETQILAMPNMVASPGDGFDIPLMISNTQPVSAIQLSLSSQANYVTGVTVLPSGYMDFSDWYFGGNQDGADYNVIITDLTLNNPIMPGMGHIADIFLYVDPNTPSGASYPIEVDKIVADANSIAMYTEMISSSVFVGTPMAHFSIDTSFSMSGSATRSIPVYLDNIVPISVFEMTLMDMPDGLIVTSVNPVGRFSEVGGLFLDNTGEDEDGNCFIFGYTVGTEIPSGSGPIFELTVQRKNYFGGQLGLFFGDLTARDENTNEVTVCGTGYAMLSVALEISDSFTIPNQYKLYQNYPNPFNPTTVIQYDVPELSQTTLTIFDLSGRQINQLINDTQSPGLKTIIWDGKDFLGNRAGAGIYIYQLKSGNFIESKKMIIVK